MKNLTKILLLAFACLSIAATAQETFTGTISYAYKLDGAQAEMLKSMMPERMDISYSERGMITETIGGMMAAAAGKIVVDFSSVSQTASLDEEIKIIPNPNDGLFIVELELKTTEHVEFKILDWNGKEVGYKKVKDKLQAGKNTIKFNEPDLVPGAYLMVIKNKQGVRVRQFLKY